jgi:hypothetical protein
MARVRTTDEMLADAVMEVAALEADKVRLEGALIERGVWREAPCCVCGYNGPGYFQPATHSCAERAGRPQ